MVGFARSAELAGLDHCSRLVRVVVASTVAAVGVARFFEPCIKKPARGRLIRLVHEASQ